MNAKSHDQALALTQKIDLLVDGELAPIRRAALLAELDSEPDGWRRCALAFLESQAFQASLPTLTAKKNTNDHISINNGYSMPDRPRRSPWLRARWAAAWLAIFALGASAGALAAQRFEAPGIIIAESAKDETRVDRAVATSRGASSFAPVAVALAGAADRDLAQRVEGSADLSRGEPWLLDQPPSISEYVQEYWKQQGFEVRENRQVVSVDLEDGSRVAIPIDQVSFQYVGLTVH